jgi:AcrR family transcriptional regulator
MATASRTRLSPEQRREQLLELGVQLLARRSLEELSIDLVTESAGISRGLLYHYFGSKQGFHRAVVRRVADDLVARTAPPPGGEPLERLAASVAAYVDYVADNFEGYRSLVQGAASGPGDLREIYESTRQALSDRVFAEDPRGEVIPDTAATRLVVRGWVSLVEETTLAWAADPHGLSRDELRGLLSAALPALVDGLPGAP